MAKSQDVRPIIKLRSTAGTGCTFVPRKNRRNYPDRLVLKEALVDPAGTDESREGARLRLQKLPRNASPVRVRGRGAIDGRPHGFLSQFGASRVRFRDMDYRRPVSVTVFPAGFI